MSFAENLANVVNRYDEISSLLSSPDVTPENLVKMNKELAELGPVVEAINHYHKAERNMNDAKSMMDDDDMDREMREMAESEYYELKEQLPKLEKEIKILLLPKNEEDEKNAILEVRAGTGGDEAALFAAVLFEMYQRYSQKQGWKFEILDADENYRQRCFLQAEIRVGRPSGAAGSGYRISGAGAYFGSYGGRVAGNRGSGYVHQSVGSEN